jgi:hypothetical protein
MFLRCTTRKKNGKEHRSWNLVENREALAVRWSSGRCSILEGSRTVSARSVWRKSIEVFEDGRSAPRTVAHFAEEQTAPIDDEQIIQVRLKDLEVRNARQWGGCWLVCELYEQLELDQFWVERLPPGRKGTRWDLILPTLCIYRFISLAVSGVCIDTGLIAVVSLSFLVQTSASSGTVGTSEVIACRWSSL